MKINSISNVAFGKVNFASDNIKNTVFEHSASCLNCGNIDKFNENCRRAEISKKFDISVDEDGVKVYKGGTKDVQKTYAIKEYDDTPYIYYYLFDSALNYVKLKEDNIIFRDKK